MKEKIERIKKQEKSANLIEERVRNLSQGIDKLDKEFKLYQDLIGYYYSRDWQTDRMFSDTETFPTDVPAGVLSEDYIYNIMMEMYGLGKKMEDMSQKIKGAGDLD